MRPRGREGTVQRYASCDRYEGGGARPLWDGRWTTAGAAAGAMATASSGRVAASHGAEALPATGE